MDALGAAFFGTDFRVAFALGFEGLAAFPTLTAAAIFAVIFWALAGVFFLPVFFFFVTAIHTSWT
jgi:hypothetical protein